MKHFKFLSISIFLLTILFACKEHVLSPIGGGSDEEINEWIYKTMEANYLWYEEVPEKESLDFSLSPDDFFYTLLSNKDGRELNGKHQYFSYIEADNQTKASTNESVYGFEFASLGFTGQNYYYAWVLYVLPGSPADEAGLKRGDWIVRINSEQGYITDLNNLVAGNAATFYLAKYIDNETGFVPNGSIEIEAARVVEDNPFLKDTVFHIGEKSIAYLVYNHFTSGPTGNSDETYNNQMKQIFANFKAKQANELVLDLRYNGGGLVTCAQLMTSLIAPSSALGDTFCILEFNDKNTNRNVIYPLITSVASSNLNLNKKIYVLTSLMTASASEAVINCLAPFIGRENIVLIGTQTLGKTVGSISFGESEKVGWILHPITLHIFNKKHEADYKNGFPPTSGFEIDELVVGQTLYELGDRRELLLSRAIQEITGQVTPKTSFYKTTERKAVNYNSFGKKRIQGLIINP